MSHVEIATIEKKIYQTEQELINADKFDNVIIKGIMKSELQLRLQELYRSKTELENSLYKETVSLRIYGEKVQEGKVSSRILLSALHGFQMMADSIANAVIHSPTEKGRIPNVIRDITDFQVVGTFAGSFGITLERDKDQLEAYSGASQLNQILDELFNVLETTDNSDSLISTIIPYGKRTITHYRKLLCDLKENSVNLEVNWLDNAANSRKICILHEKSDDIITTLNTIDKIENEDVILRGLLNGINIRNYSFELSVEGLGLIKGKSKIETLLEVSEKIGEEIEAHLVKSISLTKTNVQKISWFLSDAVAVSR